MAAKSAEKPKGRTRADEIEVHEFNPLDVANLGRSIGSALLESKMWSLTRIPRFRGGGIYVLYYQGRFPAYKAIRLRKGREPVAIYVGKSASPGRRSGGQQGPLTMALVGRLRGHADSILAARRSLRTKDFKFQFLVVHPLFITLGESLLIARWQPIWNVLLSGFGNNALGKGRPDQRRSRWDTVHPGRQGAAQKKPNQQSRATLLRMVRRHLERHHRPHMVDPADLKVPVVDQAEVDDQPHGDAAA